jgi:predicted TIM-barrel fold metal-dependent hydrolase
MGLVGAFIPVAPLPEFPYRHPIYERLWWTAQDLNQPLLLHISTPRFGVPANEFTTDSTEMTASGRSTTDYWVRYSMGAMLFAGVFDRYPRLKIGSVEHEAAWIPHWLKQMDFVYTERPVFTKGWKSREGLLPSEYWRRNMFVEFMEDDIGVKLREYIGVETMLWGSDYPHAEATFPRSQQFLARMFDGVPEADLHKITSENAAKLFRFELS